MDNSTRENFVLENFNAHHRKRKNTKLNIKKILTKLEEKQKTARLSKGEALYIKIHQLRKESRKNKHQSYYISSFKMLTEMFKQESYALLCKVADFKKMDSIEKHKFINTFWKKEYYTPEVVNCYALEKAQIMLANNRIATARKNYKQKCKNKNTEVEI
jgi:hypothetical protein